MKDQVEVGLKDDTEPEPPMNVCTQGEWQNFVDIDVKLPTVKPVTKKGSLKKRGKKLFQVRSLLKLKKLTMVSRFNIALILFQL